MNELDRKLNEGLGMSAALLDAEGAGYLGLQESQAIQLYEMEFASLCRGLATEFLHAHPEAQMAKQALRASLEEIGRATDTGTFTDDERGLIYHFASQLDAWIDREASKSERQRSITRFVSRIPPFLVTWALLIILVGITLTVALVLSK